VVNLRDIPQIGLPNNSTSSFRIIAGLAATGEIITDQRFSVADSVPQKVTKRTKLHAKFLAEVQPADFRVLCEIARLARTKDPALGHYIGPVSYAKRFAHVVIGD
jgi:hypothetical protein